MDFLEDSVEKIATHLTYHCTHTINNLEEVVQAVANKFSSERVLTKSPAACLQRNLPQLNIKFSNHSWLLLDATMNLYTTQPTHCEFHNITSFYDVIIARVSQ